MFTFELQIHWKKFNVCIYGGIIVWMTFFALSFCTLFWFEWQKEIAFDRYCLNFVSFHSNWFFNQISVEMVSIYFCRWNLNEKKLKKRIWIYFKWFNCSRKLLWFFLLCTVFPFFLSFFNLIRNIVKCRSLLSWSIAYT